MDQSHNVHHHLGLALGWKLGVNRCTVILIRTALVWDGVRAGQDLSILILEIPSGSGYLFRVGTDITLLAVPYYVGSHNSGLSTGCTRYRGRCDRGKALKTLHLPRNPHRNPAPRDRPACRTNVTLAVHILVGSSNQPSVNPVLTCVQGILHPNVDPSCCILSAIDNRHRSTRARHKRIPVPWIPRCRRLDRRPSCRQTRPIRIILPNSD